MGNRNRGRVLFFVTLSELHPAGGLGAANMNWTLGADGRGRYTGLAPPLVRATHGRRVFLEICFADSSARSANILKFSSVLGKGVYRNLADLHVVGLAATFTREINREARMSKIAKFPALKRAEKGRLLLE